MDLNLHPDTEVYGELYPPGDPAFLTDGMFVVVIGRFTLDISWIPEHDLKKGCYILTAFKDGSWDNMFAQEKTRNVKQVVRWLREKVIALQEATNG